MYSSRVTFQPHKYYGGPPTNATNEMWQRLSPPGDGIVAIPKKYTKSLPKSMTAPHDPDADVYGISMFHQLHCLVSLYQTSRLPKYASPILTTTPQNFMRFAYYPDQITDMDPAEIILHRDHCIDYIR